MSISIYNINNNDNLETVIKKCNSNFKSMISQLEQQTKIDKRDNDNQIYIAIGDVVVDVVQQIEDEASLRRQGDLTIENEIGNLATVASTGDYNDLVNVPTIPVNGAYMTFGNENPSTVHGGTWANVGTLQVGLETMNVWRRTS